MVNPHSFDTSKPQPRATGNRRTAVRQGVAAGAIVLALGLSVRFPITSVSPLLQDIGVHYGLSQSGLAALSAIPVLLFGLASPLAPWLVARLGLERALIVLLAALTVATALRPLGTPLLFGGTVVVGAAIALIGILAPQVIRRSLPKRGGFWTGVYTTAFGASAAAGAAFAVPVLTLVGGHTAAAFASWAVPLLIALGVVLAFTPALKSAGPERPSPGTSATTSVFKAPGLWPVTGFFASQALIYFSLTAWLPTIASDRGMDPLLLGLLSQLGVSWAAILLMLTAASAGKLVFGIAASRAGAASGRGHCSGSCPRPPELAATQIALGIVDVLAIVIIGLFGRLTCSRRSGFFAGRVEVRGGAEMRGSALVNPSIAGGACRIRGVIVCARFVGELHGCLPFTGGRIVADPQFQPTPAAAKPKGVCGPAHGMRAASGAMTLLWRDEADSDLRHL